MIIVIGGNNIMKLIDKDKVIAEIERRIQFFTEDSSNFKSNSDIVIALYGLKSFIDTIDIKEVDSIWNDARKTIPEDSSNQIICIKEDDLAVVTIGKLALGTKKWAYLKDLLNISNVQVKEVDLEKEVDKWYNSEASKEFENVLYKDIEKCAKYFFELGYASK